MSKKAKESEVIESEATETTEVATIDNTTAVSADVVTDQDSFLQDEAANDDGADYIPRVRLMQKGEFIGKFHSEELAMEWKEMNLSLIKITDSRVLWPEEYDSDNQPLCRSHDGIVPACDIKEDPEDDDSATLPGMSENCKDCAYAKWGRNTPPRCQAVRDLLVLDLDSNIPFYISFSSTSLTPLKKQLEKPLSFRKMALTASRAKAGLPPAHSCMFKFKMGAELRESKKGDSMIPVFSGIEILDEETQEFTVNVAFQLRNFTIRNIKDSDSGVGDDNDAGGEEPEEKF